MDDFLALLIPLFLTALLLRFLSLPIRLSWKIVLNSAAGFACLWLLNSVSGFTGMYFPINPVTALAAGFLGLPGIGVLALVQLFL